MANLPDNFSQSAFDARHSCGNTALDDEYDYLSELQASYDTFDALDDLTDAQMSEMDMIEDQMRDQRVTISMMEDA